MSRRRLPGGQDSSSSVPSPWDSTRRPCTAFPPLVYWLGLVMLLLLTPSPSQGINAPRAFLGPSLLTPSKCRINSEVSRGYGRRGRMARPVLDLRHDMPRAEDLRYDWNTGKTVTFIAKKTAERTVVEGKRSVKDYMALPPSQYSVLDDKCINRIGDDEFRCEIPGLNFFGYKMMPVVYVKVDVDVVNGRSYLKVYKLELTGSKIAEVANGTFDVQAQNVVSFHETGHPTEKTLMSDTSVSVKALVPKGNIIPFPVLQRGGSLIIQGLLNVMVPQFVRVLTKDYTKWAQGDNTRAAVADEQLAPDQPISV